MPLSHKQIKAVKFYQGDVSASDPFWGDKKAYCTLNALFFPGIENEIARASEGKKLNPAFLEDTDRLIALCNELLSAFHAMPLENSTVTRRVERLSDYRLRRKLGNTVSFTSTSTVGFLTSYTGKKGLALMRFELPAGTPCIDMSAALDAYAKAEEAEILLPPGLGLDFEDIPLTEEMLRMQDADGAPPAAACIVRPRKMLFSGAVSNGEMSEAGAAAGMRIYAALNSGTAPSAEDVNAFILWKEAFRNSILSRFIPPM